MPNYIGGDVIEVVCSHPTLGDFRFQAKSGEAFKLDPGGVRNNDDAGGVTGSGELILSKSRVRWVIDGPIAVDFMSGNELENLPALAESSEQGIWTLTHISGLIQKGKGVYVGDIEADTNTGQLNLKASGGGKLEKI